MMKHIREVSQRRYFHDQDYCPRCNGELDSSPFEADTDTAFQELTCVNPECGLVWTAVYTLSFIEMVRDDNGEVRVIE